MIMKWRNEEIKKNIFCKIFLINKNNTEILINFFDMTINIFLWSRTIKISWNFITEMTSDTLEKNPNFKKVLQIRMSRAKWHMIQIELA